jgi:Ice-binding-like
VGSSATLGTGTAFQGNVLALASISLVSGSSLTGRALALNAAVTLDHNDVTLPR